MDAPVPGPSIGYQEGAQAASVGSDFLVVWSDARSGSSELYMSRVNGAGAVVDPQGIPLGIRMDDGFALASDGTQYLLVWSFQSVIYGRRFDATGAAVEPAPFAISSGPLLRGQPRATGGPGQFLVAWQDYRDGRDYDIYAARVSSAGVTLDPSGIPVSVNLRNEGQVHVAIAGSTYLVVWNSDPNGNSSDILGARIDTAGTLLDAVPLPVCTTNRAQSFPRVASSGAGFFVAWQDFRNGNFDIYGTRVTPAGVVQDAPGLALSSVTTAETVPWVGFNGTSFTVAWQDARSSLPDIYGRRVSAAGALLEPAPVPLVASPYAEYTPAVDCAAGTCLLLWQASRYVAPLITGVRIDAALARLDPAPFLMTTVGNGQTEPAVAFGGGLYLVVWTDHRNGISDIYGVRMDPTGAVLDPSGIAIATGAAADMHPAVTYDGTGFLVVWEDTRAGDTDTYGARVTLTGQVLDPAGLPIATGTAAQRLPVVAGGGPNLLVAWSEPSGVRATRLSSTGVVMDAPPLAITPVSVLVRGGVAYGAGVYAMVWSGFLNGADVTHLVRVSASGAILDATPVNLPYLFDPTIAWDGTNFLVAGRNFATGNGDILAIRVPPSGPMLDPGGILLATGPAEDAYPTLAHDGALYLVAWEVAASPSQTDLQALRVSNEGVPLESPAFSLSAFDTSEHAAAAASSGLGHFLVVYQRYDPASPFLTQRVRARLVTATRQAAGAPCTSLVDCASNLCVDGVCCDTECGGGATDDCQACSVAMGAEVDGTCGPVAMGHSCRPSTGSCDHAETCDGTSLTCPADEQLPNGSTCPGGTCSEGVCRLPDGGISDAGVLDGGGPDGGEPVPAGPPLDLTVGCGCGAGDLALPFALGALVAFAWLRRPRYCGQVSPSSKPKPRQTARRR